MKKLSTTPFQKHLCINLYKGKLSFTEHVNDKTDKAMKSFGILLLRKLQLILPHQCSLTIYKSFIRHHLDYTHAIYDQSSNHSHSKKFESVQYRAEKG